MHDTLTFCILFISTLHKNSWLWIFCGSGVLYTLTTFTYIIIWSIWYLQRQQEKRWPRKEEHPFTPSQYATRRKISAKTFLIILQNREFYVRDKLQRSVFPGGRQHRKWQTRKYQKIMKSRYKIIILLSSL